MSHNLQIKEDYKVMKDKYQLIERKKKVTGDFQKVTKEKYDSRYCFPKQDEITLNQHLTKLASFGNAN